MNANDYAMLNFLGKDYEIRYTFDMIRKLKAYGVNVPKLFFDLSQDGSAGLRKRSMLLVDDIVDVLSALLRANGCAEATPEAVHAHMTRDGFNSIDDAAFVVMWLGSQYYNIGKTVSTDTDTEKKPVKGKRSK